MKNLCFLQSLLDLNATEKQSLFSPFKFIDSETVKPVLMDNRADFLRFIKSRAFFGSVRLKLDNSIVKTG